jgi:hypothetical protein
MVPVVWMSVRVGSRGLMLGLWEWYEGGGEVMDEVVEGVSVVVGWDWPVSFMLFVFVMLELKRGAGIWLSGQCLQ